MQKFLKKMTNSWLRELLKFIHFLAIPDMFFRILIMSLFSTEYLWPAKPQLKPEIALYFGGGIDSPNVFHAFKYILVKNLSLASFRIVTKDWTNDQKHNFAFN